MRVKEPKPSSSKKRAGKPAAGSPAKSGYKFRPSLLLWEMQGRVLGVGANTHSPRCRSLDWGGTGRVAGQKAYEVNFKDGKRDGLWLIWHENGQKAHESNWKDGKIVSQKDWDEEGELIE